MVRKRRGGNFQLVLETPDRQAGIPGADQRAVDFQPGRVTQSFQPCGSVIEFHRTIMGTKSQGVNTISRIIEISLPAATARESWADIVRMPRIIGRLISESIAVVCRAVAVSENRGGIAKVQGAATIRTTSLSARNQTGGSGSENHACTKAVSRDCRRRCQQGG